MPSSSSNGCSNGSSSYDGSPEAAGAVGGLEIKAVIYDLDGTLLDTESLSTEAIQAVVGRYGATFTWCVYLYLYVDG